MAMLSSTSLGEGDEYEIGTQAEPLYNVEEPKEAAIVTWRSECFERMGFGLGDSTRLALRRDVDREHVKRLVAEGCSVGLVMDIVL